MKKKEVLIIIVLAVLVTGLSWLYETTKETYFETSQKWDKCIYKGFPMSYYDCWAVSGAGYSSPTIEPFFLIFDFLFWFLVIVGIWKGVKLIKRGFAGKPNINQNTSLPRIFRNGISTPVAIGTVILVAVLAGAILVWQESLEDQRAKVAISTSKTEYDQEEIVEVIIKNNRNKSIWHVLDCGEEPLDVLKYEDGEWKQIHQWQLAKCPATPPIEEIRPDEIKKFKYNGIWEGLFTTEGRYKIGLKYGLTKPGNGELKEAEAIYSNEFRIKEKSEGEKSCRQDNDCVLVSTNCCPCSAGGSKACINENYLGEWQQKIDCQVGGECPEVYLCGTEPTICRCVNSVCQGFME